MVAEGTQGATEGIAEGAEGATEGATEGVAEGAEGATEGATEGVAVVGSKDGMGMREEVKGRSSSRLCSERS